MQLKTCSQCTQEKPTSEFSVDRSVKSGLKAACKECAKIAGRASHRRNKKVRNERSAKYKKENAEKIKLYNEEYRNSNPDYDKKYYTENKNRINKNNQTYWSTNREYLNEWQRNYRRENQSAIQEYSRKKYLNNKEYYKNARNLRRARLMLAEGSHTQREFISLLSLYGYLCYWCGKDLLPNDTHADHYIPLSKGGSDYISNIVPSCAKCNLSKQAKMPAEFKPGEGNIPSPPKV